MSAASASAAKKDQELLASEAGGGNKNTTSKAQSKQLAAFVPRGAGGKNAGKSKGAASSIAASLVAKAVKKQPSSKKNSRDASASKMKMKKMSGAAAVPGAAAVSMVDHETLHVDSTSQDAGVLLRSGSLYRGGPRPPQMKNSSRASTAGGTIANVSAPGAGSALSSCLPKKNYVGPGREIKAQASAAASSSRNKRRSSLNKETSAPFGSAFSLLPGAKKGKNEQQVGILNGKNKSASLPLGCKQSIRGTAARDSFCDWNSRGKDVKKATRGEDRNQAGQKKASSTTSIKTTSEQDLRTKQEKEQDCSPSLLQQIIHEEEDEDEIFNNLKKKKVKKSTSALDIGTSSPSALSTSWAESQSKTDNKKATTGDTLLTSMAIKIKGSRPKPNPKSTSLGESTTSRLKLKSERTSGTRRGGPENELNRLSTAEQVDEDQALMEDFAGAFFPPDKSCSSAAAPSSSGRSSFLAKNTTTSTSSTSKGEPALLKGATDKTNTTDVVHLVSRPASNKTKLPIMSTISCSSSSHLLTGANKDSARVGPRGALAGSKCSAGASALDVPGGSEDSIFSRLPGFAATFGFEARKTNSLNVKSILTTSHNKVGSADGAGGTTQKLQPPLTKKKVSFNITPKHGDQIDDDDDDDDVDDDVGHNTLAEMKSSKKSQILTLLAKKREEKNMPTKGISFSTSTTASGACSSNWKNASNNKRSDHDRQSKLVFGPAGEFSEPVGTTSQDKETPLPPFVPLPTSFVSKQILHKNHKSLALVLTKNSKAAKATTSSLLTSTSKTAASTASSKAQQELHLLRTGLSSSSDEEDDYDMGNPTIIRCAECKMFEALQQMAKQKRARAKLRKSRSATTAAGSTTAKHQLLEPHGGKQASLLGGKSSAGGVPPRSSSAVGTTSKAKVSLLLGINKKELAPPGPPLGVAASSSNKTSKSTAVAASSSSSSASKLATSSVLFSSSKVHGEKMKTSVAAAMKMYEDDFSSSSEFDSDEEDFHHDPALADGLHLRRTTQHLYGAAGARAGGAAVTAGDYSSSDESFSSPHCIFCRSPNTTRQDTVLDFGELSLSEDI